MNPARTALPHRQASEDIVPARWSTRRMVADAVDHFSEVHTAAECRP